MLGNGPYVLGNGPHLLDKSTLGIMLHLGLCLIRDCVVRVNVLSFIPFWIMSFGIL